ncbi:disease resistance protein RPV1-like [Lolium rigidum]|uniref:disease resistance protein RPV1-like n=1 Tax=Lolium rigidum TaxID=89674 RepID=UPI001F5DEE7E|nr:disease resistance protein RPV1-like [Lolium rigidum]
MHELAHILARILRGSDHYMLKINHYGNLGDDVNARALRCVGCSRVEFNDDTFSSRRCLHVLELKESSIQKLPDSISQLRCLGHLKIIGFSGLIALPESFGLLTNLIYIELSGCPGLVNLTKSFGKLIRLVHVDLSGCSALPTLPQSFGKLIRLVHVNLSGCAMLATLPESFGNLVNLSHVDLSCCHRLSDILEVLQKLVKLVYLDLSSWSCFEGIGKCLGGLTNLEHLNLSNPCSYLAPHRSSLQQLKYGLGKLTSLRYLNLSMCLNHIFYYKTQEESLQYIQSCVSSLSSLEHLDLSHNILLADLPQSLGNLNKLHTLDLSGCIRLKKIGEMKSLKFIALRNCRGLVSCNFVVHIIDDDDIYSSSNIVQLETVNCQELQISGLEKVKYEEEAQRIRLLEKQKLEKLKLSWTLDSIRSVEDTALLGELVPPPNLQCLEINGYDGTCLPEYLSDLTSLRELKIVCCKQLISLPDSIKELTNLAELCIFDCPELEKWCQLEEIKKMLAHIPNKNYQEHASTSWAEIEEDGRSINEVKVA